MRTDKRRIQTAVLGGADSDEPLLLLPMEAIERDASAATTRATPSGAAPCSASAAGS
ncbi:hypothetical protein [Streptomyces sp. NPDC058045]|uniref:hypothetical protein n=1 Tax=Streptomyces sp. NPDC058045 TaxID=3346311 RepID=UPI0036E9DE01